MIVQKSTMIKGVSLKITYVCVASGFFLTYINSVAAAGSESSGSGLTRRLVTQWAKAADDRYQNVQTTIEGLNEQHTKLTDKLKDVNTGSPEYNSIMARIQKL